MAVPVPDEPSKYRLEGQKGIHWRSRLRDYAQLVRLDASQSFIGCQFQFFKLTLVEIPDFVLQCRLGNGPHLECQRN